MINHPRIIKSIFYVAIGGIFGLGDWIAKLGVIALFLIVLVNETDIILLDKSPKTTEGGKK